MQQVIIRDDDTSFFTRPAQLEAIYAPLWERGHPVCLSVVPAARADARVRHRPGQPFDPNIPPDLRGQSREFPVTENGDLCAYLNQRAREGLVEICLHGYSHTYMEFLTQDEAALTGKLNAGRQSLERAFPDAPIRSFVAPYDRLSPAALRCVLDAGFNLCVASTELQYLPALAEVGTYQAVVSGQGAKIFTCDEYLFTHRDLPERCLASAQARLRTEQTLILANHYWCFYFDWAEPLTTLVSAWHTFVGDLLAQPDIRFTTFSAAECRAVASG